MAPLLRAPLSSRVALAARTAHALLSFLPSWLAPLALVASLLVAPSIARAQDQDGDGVPDSSDNCVAFVNASQLDSDADGVGDVCDNCVDVANGPDAGLCSDQQDADGDGYGNACDTDLNGDGTTGMDEFNIIWQAQKDQSQDPLTDFDCDGVTGLDDFSVWLADTQGVVSAGPSGYACAGSTPCPPGVIGSPLPASLHDLVADSPTSVSGRMAPCETNTWTTASLCDRSVLVYDPLANTEVDPPLQEVPVASDDTWTATGLTPGRLYGFHPKTFVAHGVPETTAMGAPVFRSTLENPIAGGGSFELAGRTPVETFVGNGGSARVAIDVRVPPGSGGMEPVLGLSYGSDQPNGLLGIGWALQGVSYVHRCQPTLAQDGVVDAVDFDANDRLCWSGRRLVQTAGTGRPGFGGTEYRLELDEFARVVAHGDAGTDAESFEIFEKSGRRLEFRQIVPAPPEYPGRVQYWALTRVSDRSTNHYDVIWEGDVGRGELRPASIEYGGNLAAGTAHYASIEFAYEPRSDVIDRRRGATREYTSVRLAGIESLTGAQPVMRYELSYDEGATGSRSRLRSIVECGTDPSGATHCLPPTTLDWNSPAGESASGSLGWVDSSSTVVANFDGDGFADLLLGSLDGCDTRVYLSPGSGIVSAPSPDFVLSDGPSSSCGGSGGFHFTSLTEDPVRLAAGDFDGDGRDGLLVWDQDAGDLWIYDSIDSSTPTSTSQWSGQHAGTTVYAADFTGDGVSDVLVYGELALTVYRVIDGVIDTTALSSTPSGSGELSLGDFNGDGLADVFASDGIHLNEAGTFGPPVSSLSGAIEIKVADFTGDGTDDVIAYASGVWTAYRVANGVIGDVVFTTSSAIGGVEDLNGDGVSDLIGWDLEGKAVVRFVENGVPGPPVTLVQPWGFFFSGAVFADLSGDGVAEAILHTVYLAQSGIKAVAGIEEDPGDRIVAITDGLGASTSLLYRPLTDSSVYQVGLGADAPLVDVVPSTSWVVKTLSRPDGIGGQRTFQHSYGGLRLDRLRGASAGFEWTLVEDPAGTTTRIDRFLQDFPLTGRIARSETYVGPGSTQTEQVENLWAAAATAEGLSSWILLEESTRTTWELDGSLIGSATTRVESVDDWGNATGTLETHDDGWSRAVSRTFDNDESSWLLGVLSQESITATSPESLQETRATAYPEHDPVTGLVTRRVDDPGSARPLTFSYSYDAWGNPVQVTMDPDAVYGPARSRTTAYDALGRFPETASNSLGHQTALVFDARWGEPSLVRDPNGHEILADYDAIGRRTRVVRPDGTESVTAYRRCTSDCPDGASLAVDAVASGKPPSTTYLDVLERPLQTLFLGPDGKLAQVDSTYDELGRKSSDTWPHYEGDPSLTTTYAYDLLGRLTTSTSPNGEATHLQHAGRSTTTTDDLGSSTTRTLDSQGQLVSVVDALGGAAAYTYWPLSGLHEYVGPDGPATRVTRTYELGQLKTIDDPNSAATTLEYYGTRELRSTSRTVSGAVEETTFSYDALGRRITSTAPEGTTTWTYDASPDGIGRLASITSPHHTVSIEYDSFGRPVAQMDDIDGDVFEHGVGYDSAGRPAFRDYPGEFSTETIYRHGYPSEVWDNHGSRLWKSDRAFADGAIEQFTLGNGITTTHTREPMTRRLAGIVSVDAAGSDVQRLGIEYDEVGRIHERTDELRPGPGGLPFVETYAYDPLGRLESTTSPSSSIQYGYSPGGRIWLKSDVGSFSYGEMGAGPDHLTSISGTTSLTFGYDDKGNDRDGLGRSISWTSFDRPSTIVTDAGATLQLTYGVTGAKARQVLTAPGEGTTTKTWVGRNYERVESSSWPVVEQHDYVQVGDLRVALVIERSDGSLETRYFHHDHLGSVVAASDELGNVIDTYYYDPHGRPVDGLNTPLPRGARSATSPSGFTGHEHLDSFGLVDAGARLYDPTLGRFLSRDPVVQSTKQPQTLNPYAYALNDPLSWVDPSGMFLAPVGFNTALAFSFSTALASRCCTTDEPEEDPVGVIKHVKICWCDDAGDVDDGGTPAGTGEGIENASGGGEGSGPGGGPAGDAVFLTPFLGDIDALASGAGMQLPQDPKASTGATGATASFAAGVATNSVGLSLGIGEMANVRGSRWRASKPLKDGSRPFYDARFHGNQYTGGRNAVLRRGSGFRFLGRLFFGIGTAMSIGDAYDSAISPGQAAQDVTFGAVGTFLGPIGMFASGTYFGSQAAIEYFELDPEVLSTFGPKPSEW